MPDPNTLSNAEPIAATQSTPIKPSPLRIIRNLFVAFVGAYGVNLTLFLILRILVGERWTLIAMFNSLLHLLLIPTLILLPIALLMRRWWVGLTLVPAVVTFLISYSPFFLSQTVTIASDAQPFTLLTYNLHAEIEHLEPMLSLIEAADADIVALQELSPRAAAFFVRELTGEYPYQALNPNPSNGIFGQGVLSRFPIEADQYWHIHLGHQRVQLNLNGETLVLFNGHPIQPLVSPGGFQMRGEEVTFLLDQAAAETAPVMLVGDFNMSDQSEDYRQITSRYTDSYREVGWGMGFTWPSVSPLKGVFPPLLRLDYVFHSDHLQAVEAQVWPSSGGSDHRPLLVHLSLETTP